MSFHEPLFISSTQLGVLEARLELLIASSDKRDRQRKFKKLTALIKELFGLSPNLQVRGLALGCNSLGERGAWIIFDSVRVEAELPSPQEQKPHVD